MRKNVIIMLALLCLCAGCAKTNPAELDTTGLSQDDTTAAESSAEEEGSTAEEGSTEEEGSTAEESSAEAESSTAEESSAAAESETETESVDIEELMASKIPLSHYRYSIYDKGILKGDITEYEVSDEELFKVWDQDGLFMAEICKAEAAEEGIGLVPVELHVDKMKFKALKLDNGIYIVDSSGSFEIWKDEKCVRLSAGTVMKLCSGWTDVFFYDITKTGTPQLCIAAYYRGGLDEARGGVFVFDMENMRFIEYEDSEPYVMKAYKEIVEAYVAEGRELKEGYKFCLSDGVWDPIIVSRNEQDGELQLRQNMGVKYSFRNMNGGYHYDPTEKIMCSIDVFYEYSPERDMFCVSEVVVTE